MVIMAEDNDKDETSVDPIDGCDHLDGIFKPKRKGHYRPRVEEMESWGQPIANVSTQAETEICLHALLRVDPDYRWRTGLASLLQKCEGVEQCQRNLQVLYSMACEGLKANQKGEGESVYFDISSAPDELCCTDWLDIIDGLSFTTSSPGTVRDISYIDVQIGPQTDEKVLKGFCCFMDSLNNIPWDTLRVILAMDKEDGLQLYQTVTRFRNGYEVEADKINLIERLQKKYPQLLKDIGFMHSAGQDITWQKSDNEDLDRTFYMMFTSSDNIETAI